jgi:Leucine-rich repeat (LRR) protein
MKKQIILNENQYRVLFESDDFSLQLKNLKKLLESGQEENIELAFQLGEGMESYVPNFNMGRYILSNYGTLIKMILGYMPKGNVGTWHNEEIYTYVVKSFIMLFSSKELKLFRKGLTKFPDDISKLQHIELLDLSDNQLTFLPESIGLLKNLSRLNLSDNKISELPSSMKNMSNLRAISLSNNEMYQLPKNLLEFTQLEFLDISYNNFLHLPQDIDKLANLEILFANDNKLSTIPHSLSNIKSWTLLDFKYNHILPSEQRELQQLFKVKIDF